MTNKQRKNLKRNANIHNKFVRAHARNFTRVDLENLPRIRMRDLISDISRASPTVVAWSTEAVLTQMENHIGGRWSIINPEVGYTSIWNQWVVFEQQQDLDLLRLIYG